MVDAVDQVLVAARPCARATGGSPDARHRQPRDQAVDGAHVPIHPVSADRTESELKLGRHAVDHDIGDALDEFLDDLRDRLRSTFRAFAARPGTLSCWRLRPLQGEGSSASIPPCKAISTATWRPLSHSVLRLFAAGAGGRIECRRRFAPAAPLIRNRIIELVGDPTRAYTPIASRCWSSIPRSFGCSLDTGIDPRLGPCAHARARDRTHCWSTAPVAEPRAGRPVEGGRAASDPAQRGWRSGAPQARAGGGVRAWAARRRTPSAWPHPPIGSRCYRHRGSGGMVPGGTAGRRPRLGHPSGSPGRERDTSPQP